MLGNSIDLRLRANRNEYREPRRIYDNTKSISYKLKRERGILNSDCCPFAMHLIFISILFFVSLLCNPLGLVLVLYCPALI